MHANPSTTTTTTTTPSSTSPPPSGPPSAATTSTTLSSHRFPFLSETSSKPILLWHARSMHTSITTPGALCRELDAAALHGKNLRCARVPIPRGCSRLDVHVRDTYEEPLRSRYKMYPNQDSSIASVGLPTGVWLRRLVLGQFRELFVVSPEGSPASSPASSESSAAERW